MTFNNSDYTFIWKKFNDNIIFDGIPAGNKDYIYLFEYKDKDGKKVQEKRTWWIKNKSDLEWARDKNDLYFYQPHIRADLKNHLRYGCELITSDISSFQTLINGIIKNILKPAEEGKPFIHKESNSAYHRKYSYDFSAKFGKGDIVIKIDIGSSYSDYFKEEEIIELKSISDIQKTLKELKRRKTFLQQKYVETYNKWNNIKNLPVYETEEENLYKKILDAINKGGGNTGAAKNILKLIKSLGEDETK